MIRMELKMQITVDYDGIQIIYKNIPKKICVKFMEWWLNDKYDQDLLKCLCENRSMSRLYLEKHYIKNVNIEYMERY